MRKAALALCVACVFALPGAFTAQAQTVRSELENHPRIAKAIREMQDAIAYADNWSDRSLLEQVGRAVVVHPRGRLLRLARARGWNIVRPRRPARARLVSGRSRRRHLR